jgi:hypothetical protein
MVLTYENNTAYIMFADVHLFAYRLPVYMLSLMIFEISILFYILGVGRAM